MEDGEIHINTEGTPAGRTDLRTAEQSLPALCVRFVVNESSQNATARRSLFGEVP